MKTKIPSLSQLFSGALFAGAALFLAAIGTQTTVQAQYIFRYTTLNTPALPTGISGEYVVGSDFLYNLQTGTSSTLDVPGSTFTTPIGINGNNIVGNYGSSGGTTYGFLYTIGIGYSMLSMGPYGTYPNAVSGDTVVGYYENSGYEAVGFLYNFNTGTYSSFGVPGAVDTYPWGISGNNAVGNYQNASGNSVGFLYNTAIGGLTILSVPGASSTSPHGISGNNVVGTCTIGGVNYGFLYNGSTYTTFSMPGASSTTAGAIDGGNIVGFYEAGNVYYGYLATFGIAPAITTEPQSQSVYEGNPVSFTVSATGMPQVSYQWQFNGTNLTDGGGITGSLTSVLTISNPWSANAGYYDVVVSNAFGLATSTAALLVVTSPVQNPSFETPVVGPTGSFYSFEYNPTGAVWTFTGSAGIAANGSGFMYYAPHPYTSYGNQFAFLRGGGGIGGTMFQTMSNLAAGQYAFTFNASLRQPVGTGFQTQPQTVTVLVDNANVGSFSPPDTNWYSYETTPISLPAGNHVLTFTNLPAAGDATVFVDMVGVLVSTNASVQPRVQFAASPTNGAEPLSVQFSCPGTDGVGNSIVNWNWNFGDGSTSTNQNPSHTYAVTGTFNPTLIVTNSPGIAIPASGPSITVTSAPPIHFTATPTNGAEPLAVQFSSPSVDTLGYPIVGWDWSFGDGSTSTNQNPLHTYLTTGVFAPALIATNGPGAVITGLGPKITVTPTPPVVSFSPLTNGQQVTNLVNFGGFASYNFSAGSTATFSIHELDINGGSGWWWNGTDFQATSNTLSAAISGTNWTAAAGVALPQLNSGQIYQLFVTVTNSTARASTNITVQAAITVLTWDPGQTPLGTEALQSPNTNGGNYLFEIVPPTPAYGVWRTALNVFAGQAGVYVQEGSPPTINNYTYVSDRAGSNGFVLDSSQFSAAQPWYILVNATPNARWNLVTGDIFVYNLGSLAADSSSSTNVGMGAEGMAFFETKVPPSTLAWQLWLGGLGTNLCVKKSSAPDPLANDSNYDLNQVGQMLVVPPYLDGQTYDGYYFISVPGLPGTPINLDSRQQPITTLPFNSFTNLTVASNSYPYVTYQIQVPVQSIAWQVNLSPSNGAPAIAARLAQVPNEFNNDAYSDVGGGVGNSVSLVPSTAGTGPLGLGAGTYYVTVYGTGSFSCGFTNGNPVITPVCFFFNVTNDAPNRVGWRYYSVLDINSQLGSLGWELLLSNAPAGSQIAVRRNAVPGEWNYRNSELDNSYASSPAEYADQWSIENVLQQPRHQADIWYIGVYSPAQPLGNFVLTGQQFDPQPMGFDNSSNSISVTDQPIGWWQFFKVAVPSDTNLAGWDLRLTNVTAGNPEMVVCRDELADGLNNYGPDWPEYDLPWAGTTWSDGDQWAGGMDWTGDYYNSADAWANVNMLEMGMGNPLQPGTYYVGVYDPDGAGPDSYTLESRGIGMTGYTIPVLPLNWANGVVTNTLAPREAAYYSVVIPTNTPSWRVRLAPTSGEAILLAQENYLPNVGAVSYGSAVYPASEYGTTLDPSGGILMEKEGNEHYLLLPQNGQSTIPAGTYYLGVASQGVNPGYNQIGSNATTYVLESLGPLPIINLGVAGTNDLVITNNLLEGGDVAAYQFIMPPGLWNNSNRVDMFITMSNVTAGTPAMSLAQGMNVPSTGVGYGEDGGANPSSSGSGPYGSSPIIPSPDPTPGVYTLAIQQTSPYSNTTYTVDIHLRLTPSIPIAFDGAGNSVSVSNQPMGYWHYYQVVVPSDTNLLGWDLRLTNVTAGSPQLVICQDQLALGLYTYGLDWPDYSIPWAGTTWLEDDQWEGELDWTRDYYNSTGGAAGVSMLEMGMGNPLQPGTYYIGVYDPNGGPDSYTLESRGIGITNYSIPVPPLNWANGIVTNTLAPREAAYYSVVIPTNTPSWRVLLTNTTGDSILLAQENYLPNVGAEPYGSAAYPATAENLGYPSGGILVEKAGNEHYLLLPQNGQSTIPAGKYYLGVVSEGVNSQPGYEIGSNATTCVLKSLGPLPIINLGVAGTDDLVITNNLLEGGDVAAYQFTMPPGLWNNSNRVDMFITLTNVTAGTPTMSLAQGTNVPSTGVGYGEDGGASPSSSGSGPYGSSPIIPSPDPTPGVYTLAIQQTSPYSDTSYTLDVHLRLTPSIPIPFDGAGNSVSVSNQQTGYWHYYQVVVPSDTNLLGWDLRLTNVTAGNPQLVVCQDQLALGLYTSGLDWPFYSMPWAATTWVEGDQWEGGPDWTGDYDNSTGGVANVSMLEMGMGNPLQPGTYYIGVYDPNGGPDSYTLESRGIGITNYSVPVPPLNWANGIVTNTLAPREAAYYSVVIPTNTPSWRVRLAPTTGDAILLAQEDYLPNVGAAAAPYGSAAYPDEEGLDPSGGILMEKAGNEHYLLLPQEGQSTIPAGTYYLGVVSEGVNSQPGYEIGSNATTYVLESLGPLPITSLGTVGTSNLAATNTLLEGGDFSAYQFATPTNILGVELLLEGVVGNPAMSLAGTSLLPGAYYPYYGYFSSEGGQNYGWYGANLITVRNPASGTSSLLVNAATASSGLTPDAEYTLQVMELPTPPLNISSLLNTNGGTNMATGTLADGESAFFEVNVPANVNGAPVLGWNLAVSESSGSAMVRVRENLLPDNTCDTTAFASGSIVVAPPYLSPGTWYVEINASGSTTYTLTSSVITTNTMARTPWVMPTIGQTNTAPGLVLPEFGDTGVDTNGAALPGDQGVDLAQGQYDFYAIIVPTNNAGLLRTELQAISGNPYLFIRVGAAPTRDHDSLGSCGEGSSLVDRELTGGATEYGNWVPLNGQTATNLTPGLWVLSVYASGSDARYRLQLSCGTPVTNLPAQTMPQGGMCMGGSITNETSSALVQILPLDGSVTYTNQQLAGGDWRYYLVQIPTNAPNDLVVSWTAAQGNPHLFVRDTVPPGDGANASDYNAYPGGAITWSTDMKNEGPYPDFASPGSDTLTTPPLRPGADYYLGFWSPDDATFSVTCITNGGYIDITNVVMLSQSQIAATIPPYGCVEYQINLPTNATGIVFDANNSSNVVLSLEQGTVAIPGGPAQWVGLTNNSTVDEPFDGGWPWLPGYRYYLTATNTSAAAGTFHLTIPGQSLQPILTGVTLSGANLVLTGSSGMSGSTYYVLMSTNLALPLNKWTPVATNQLNLSGNFTITATNAVSRSVPQRFYILETQ